jgi:transcriptional regulator with XRE-family HTH domain
MAAPTAGERLKAWREGQAPPLSQSEAAEACDTSQVMWSRFENGLRIPDLLLALRIASFTKGIVTVESWAPKARAVRRLPSRPRSKVA